MITNENRKKKRRVKFKSFVRPDKIKQKQAKVNADVERRGTLPASFFKSNWRPKKLHLEGMSAFVDKPVSARSSNNSPAVARRATLPTRPRAHSDDEQLMLSLLKKECDASAAVQATDSEDGLPESDLSVELPLANEEEREAAGEEPASEQGDTSVNEQEEQKEGTAVNTMEKPTSELKKQDSWMVVPGSSVGREDSSVNEQEEKKEAIYVQKELSPTDDSPAEEEPLLFLLSVDENHLSNSGQIIERTVDL